MAAAVAGFDAVDVLSELSRGQLSYLPFVVASCCFNAPMEAGFTDAPLGPKRVQSFAKIAPAFSEWAK